LPYQKNWRVLSRVKIRKEHTKEEGKQLLAKLTIEI
jgi:hypothetical protein